jgi:hypothetical protein
MPYAVRLISEEEKDDLYDQYGDLPFHTSKAEIHGCCIKLLTLDKKEKETWEDNFHMMSETTRSHGRVVVLHDASREQIVLYERFSRTAFVFNIDYYGWIKSVALAVAGDMLEDQHRIHSVHGASLDINGMGVTLIAPSGTGKTTHSWGLLRAEGARLVSDDWFYVRLSNHPPLAFGSEKNCYVDADIAKVWPEYRPLVEKAVFDKRGRAVVNVRFIAGQGSVIPMTSLRQFILLKRDAADKRQCRKLDAEEALAYLVEHDFCNPHQMVRDERKLKLRSDFFRRMLQDRDIHLINTAAAAEETQALIRRAIGVKR